MEIPKNVFNEPLEVCGKDPITGFFRNGYCDTCEEDYGSHVICVKLTDEFLEFSKSKGNDLSTPAPEFGFPGLNSGDKWCLCGSRWKEAYDAGKAPKVYLKATHKNILQIVPIEVLLEFQAD